ncbi:LD29171p [Strongyloides ratti]|uniref:LD29171p n=1 Tax=Strongyloides ratti TaxID=34506 RepID=A0A090LK06_STRRB|nr:LD29171p [Strongyloides ratti]CEF68473.1 LD29171p [Strongyloides ratti]
MFLKTSIERIYNDKDIKKKDHINLKKACETALEALKSYEESDNNICNGSILPTQRGFVLADNFFLPFELACQAKSSRIVITSLDCLQKLIAYGHLQGNILDYENNDRMLIDRIVETICYPFQGPHTDDAVQLQIIKAILAVVLSPSCHVHNGSLLLAIKTCFNIYLASKSNINQATARGILTQIINTVFEALQKKLKEKHLYKVDDNDENIIKDILESIINKISHEIDPNIKKPTSSNSSIIEDNSECSDSISNEFLNEQVSFSCPEEKDAFLLFRALCRLSMKALPDNPDFKSHELRSKLLSLEMLLLIIQNFHINLPDKHCLVFAIRHYLCVALSKNSVSPFINVFEKSLAIFVLLVNKFKTHLKLQIEVFFREIILNILESGSSSFEHKWIVLNTVAKICEVPQSIVDIYVNYDCHLTSYNIFENLISILAKIAMGGTVIDPTNLTVVQIKEKEKCMKVLGLNSLVEILQCLTEWYSEVGSYAKVADNEQDSDPETTSISQFTQLKQQKSIIEHGIDLFAKKATHGIKYLQEKNIVGTEPAQIAKFFFGEDRLDKTVVGDYLGDGNSFNKEVMYSYIDLFDFTNMNIVAALRLLLEKFRLPGEAQKIDRLMEKFASRFCECNSNLRLFASADTAYVLSYSIIMLTTDLHSPQVKNKMTKEQYIAMNRGINDSADLPQEYLSEIYDEIASNEIKMKPTLSGKRNTNNNLVQQTARQRKLIQNMELQSISENAFALMEQAARNHIEFTNASHIEHVRPMFEITWTPCLAAFSIGLQASDDIDIWSICLDGFKLGIRISCLFQMSLERNAYVQALARFTLLTAKNSIREMKPKNVESIKLLMLVGEEDGDYLEECWYDVLKCISQLELAQSLVTSNGKNNMAPNGQSIQLLLKNNGHVDEKLIHSLQECLGEASSQNVIVAVDKIFQNSSRLNGDAIVHFVTQLCKVSLEELTVPGRPRLYMLQKIVEISFYNMDRIRIEWSRIWLILGEHFNVAGCSSRENVSHFALDALKQLSMKFLERGELPNFRFQKEFMKPFEVIMQKSSTLECREMILACIANMVHSHSNRIKSGWKNIFSLFMVAGRDNRSPIVECAFQTVTHIITEVCKNNFISIVDFFQDAVKCLSEFSCNYNFPDISMESIKLIRYCADHVSKNTHIFVEHCFDDLGSNTSTPSMELSSPLKIRQNSMQKVWVRGWFPIFSELYYIINDCKLDVRTRSLTVMFDIIKTYGSEFEDEWWKDLFNVLFKIFDFSKLRDNPNHKNEWMTTTCNHALYAVVDVFTKFYNSLIPTQMLAFYELLYFFTEQLENDNLSRSAINCLEILILSCGEKFNTEMWDHTIDLYERIFDITMPHCTTNLLNSISPTHTKKEINNEENIKKSNELTAKDKSDDQELNILLNQYIAQLELVNSINSLLFKKVTGVTSLENIEEYGSTDVFGLLNTDQLLKLVSSLIKSHKVSREFSTNSVSRTVLWKALFKGKKKLNVVESETKTVNCVLSILFKLIEPGFSEKEQTIVENIYKTLRETCMDCITYYLLLDSASHKTTWQPIICLILNHSVEQTKNNTIEGKEFSKSLAPIICKLIENEEPKCIRTLVSNFFEQALKNYL